MSNFSRVGKREKVRQDKRKAKRHLKRMYAIMDELDEVAKAIYFSDVEWTEDNIEEVAEPHTDLEIADMERFMLLGKLSQLKQLDESRDNTK